MPKETIRSSRSISLEVTCTSTLTSTEHLVAAYGHHKGLLLLRNRTANFLRCSCTNSWTSSEMNESTMRSWRRLQPSHSVGAVRGTVEVHMERCSLSNRSVSKSAQTGEYVGKGAFIVRSTSMVQGFGCSIGHWLGRHQRCTLAHERNCCFHQATL